MMKLTKNQKAELMQAYETWWYSYLNGDVKTYDSFFTDDFHFVGSTNGEEYLNRKDTTGFFEATADQLTGKAELRNLKRTIEELDGGLVLITDLADAYVINEPEWVFYSRFRFTSIMKETSYGWRFIYQHFSAPDTKAQEGETLGTEQITKENQELRDAIRRRTAELENKTRDLEIEAALEKVRAQALGMKKPDDILDICKVMFNELQSLGFASLRNTLINFWDDSRDLLLDYDYSDYAGGNKAELVYSSHPVFEQFQKKIKKSKDAFAKLVVKKEMLESWKKRRRDSGEYEDPRLNNIPALYYYFYSIGVGAIGISTFSSITEEKLNVLKRFRNVFEFAYRRYADVSQAEAQTREAQIEVAVERVRAKALAMHKSEDLHSVVVALKKELMKLQIPDITAATIYLEQNDGSIRVLDLSDTAGEDDDKPQLQLDKVFRLEDTDPKLWIRRMWNRKQNYFVLEANEDDFVRIVQWIKTVDPHGAEIAERIIREKSIKKAWLPTVKLEKGVMNIDLLAPPTPEIENILLKMGAGFDLAYKRFLDLQNAEAQAREAKIEAALERVRSKAMAMHSSKDLTETIREFYVQIGLLNGTPQRCGVSLFDKETHNSEFTSMYTTQEGKSVEITAKLKLTGHPILENMYEHWLMQKEYHPILRGREIKEYYQFIKPQVSFPDPAHDDIQYGYYFFFPEGTIYAWTEAELTEPELDIYRKFTTVLSLTYKRYKDLKLAEAQAREAHIELALERVRAKTMAMHQSNEVMDVAVTLFDELQKLDFTFGASTIIIMDKNTGDMNQWIAGFKQKRYPESFHIYYFKHPCHDAILEAWKKGEKYFVYHLAGAEKKSYDEEMFTRTAYKNFPEEQKDWMQQQEAVVFSLAFMKHGAIHWGPTELSSEQAQILRRFAKVFEQTYTRFLDLQKAESQARQAKIETALEKVRARALAMQEPEELKNVAEVLRNEMGLLGVEELETCSIYIHDETINRTECWYALKDIRSEERKLVSDHFPLNLHDTWVGREMGKFYGSDAKQVSILMQGDQRKEWINYCEEKSIPLRGYYGDVIPDRTYHLYKFSHGAMGAASAGEISAESWDLLQRTASVFSLAYSRFKDLTQSRFDLQRLKQEKQRAETALSVLQTTQKQLIQSEKMASLGELTAGIAHEIQNPLNFVNNFSEVSNELISEMVEEADKGNTDEVKTIAKDVQKNLEKILHHGKRADAIVKGMLQHSRSSNGAKEPTDINALADEYLRLAYHGLRAKDKSFNATMNTDFDETIGNINIIPQDIGRVLLNLITNAFYVVDKKKKSGIHNYEPTVSVSTKKSGGNLLISVSDNGNGIPHKVMDKIFQPFFTTKPTGEGTGLGLSLSYDIVKAHGGELKVETQEGEGSEFIIQLPFNTNNG